MMRRSADYLIIKEPSLQLVFLAKDSIYRLKWLLVIPFHEHRHMSLFVAMGDELRFGARNTSLFEPVFELIADSARPIDLPVPPHREELRQRFVQTVDLPGLHP
jgi:hypothetical protein